MIQIRKYQKKDTEKLKKMIKEVLIELFGYHIMRRWENLKEYAVLYVIEDKGKIIGSAGLRDDGKGVVKLKRMYLYKEYRKRGLGQKLFNKILDFAIKNNYKKIRLTTERRLKDSIKFYKRNGFKEIKNPKPDEWQELKNEKVNVKKVKFMEKKLCK